MKYAWVHSQRDAYALEAFERRWKSVPAALIRGGAAEAARGVWVMRSCSRLSEPFTPKPRGAYGSPRMYRELKERGVPGLTPVEVAD